MKAAKFARHFLCLLVVLLAITIFVLVVISPVKFLDVTAVYKGF